MPIRKDMPSLLFENLFARNIDDRGRLARGVTDGLLVIGGIITCGYNIRLCVILIGSGEFMLFEEACGLWVIRVCGVKTRM